MIQRIKNSKFGKRILSCAIACAIACVMLVAGAVAASAASYTSWPLLGCNFSSLGIYQSNVLVLDIGHLYAAMNDWDTDVLYNTITYKEYSTGYLSWYKNSYSASVLTDEYSVYLGSKLTSATLSEESDTPAVNREYLLCYPSSTDVTVDVDTFPTVAYTIEIDGKEVNAGSIEYGICVVSYPVDGAVTFTFINPTTSAAFSGQYGSQVTISTEVDGGTWFDEDLYTGSEYEYTYALSGSALSAIQTSVEHGSSVNQGDVINLSGSWSGNTMIFYTTDGTVPVITWDDDDVTWLENTGWDGISTGWSAGENTYLYNEETGIAVTADESDTTDTTFEINAVVVYANRGTAAEGYDDYLHADATFTYYLFDQQFGTPMANRANNGSIAQTDYVMLSLDADTLSVLNSFPCYADGSFFLVEYGTQTDSTASVQAADALADTSASSTVTVTGDTPIEGVQYATYLSYLNTGAVVWPTVQYIMETSANASSKTNEDVADSGTIYQYGTRTITRTARSGGGYNYTITYQNPDSIKLTGATDATIQLHTVTTAMSAVVGGYNVKVKLSNLATFKYTVIGQLSTPVITPTTSESSMTSVNAGDNIVLVATASDTSIYYTTDGTVPSVTWSNNAWEPDSDATKLYTTGSIIVPSPTDWQSAGYVSTFTVNAITVSNDNSLTQSDVANCPYYVSALPAADAPTASPSTSTTSPTALANGTNIYLSTTVSGGQIYYTTNGTYPDVATWFEVYGAACTAGSTTTAAEAEAYAQTGVSRYNSSTPIVMQTESGSDFIVKAVTIDASTVPSYSISDDATFTYTLAAASAPTALPTTSSTSTTTVDIGDSIILLSAETSTSIYYTTNGTTPSITWSDAAGAWVTGADTMLYTGAITVPGPENGIGAVVTTTFTINAVSVSSASNLVLQSDVATFTYLVNPLPSAPVPTVSPTTSADAITALANGTSIYLSCSISGGQIYYTTNNTYPDAAAWITAYNAAYDMGLSETAATTYAYNETGVTLYSSSSPIAMAADASGSFTIQAVTVDASSVPSYSISNAASYTFTLAAASAPTAIPATSTDSITTVEVGDGILLLTTDSTASIFYTTNGSTPSVVWSDDAGAWVANSTSTLLYTGAIAVPGASDGMFSTTTSVFTINAIAISASDTVLQSDMVSYTYLVNPLPTAAAPTASPTTSTDVLTTIANGTEIYLSCSISGGQIYYTTNSAYPDAAAWITAYNTALAVDGATAETAAEAATTATGVSRYSSASPIIMASGASGTFTIKAVTVDESTTPSYSVSDVATYTYSIASVSTPTAIPTTSTDSITTVEVGSSILLLTTDANTRIYYTTDGSVPEVIWDDTIGPVAATDATTYYSGAITVPSTENGHLVATSTTLTINAIAISAVESVLQSGMATFTYVVNPLPSAAAPTASPTTSADSVAQIANGTSIYLSCSLSGGQIYYTTNNTYPDAAAWVAAYNAALELLADDENAAAYAAAAAYNATGGVSLYSGSSPITMAADANGSFTVQAVTVDGSSTPSYSVSDAAIFTFALATASAPTAIPTTSADSITSVEVGDNIMLLSADSNTSIYYTTNGNTPSVTWDTATSTWVAGTDTMLYTGAITVPSTENGHLVATSTTLTINAIAISTSGNVQQSSMATFTYVVNPLPTAAAPTASPTTSADSVTQIANGTSIYLSCSLSGGQIYYTTNNTYPDAAAWVAAYDIAYADSKDATAAAEAATAETGVSLYSSSSPIIMAADASGSFTVQAVTVDGSSTPSYSVSAVASYTYTIASVSAPTAIPTTSADSITTVEVGSSIVLLSANSNTSIYYTTNGSTPSVTQNATTGEWVAGADTMLYTGAITVPSTENGHLVATSTTLTINAIAVSASGDVLQSGMATFTYLVNPLPAAASPTASPTTSADSVTQLADGTSIYLSCSVSGGQIYYTTNNTYPDAAAWVAAYDIAYADSKDATAAAEAATAETGVSLYSSSSPIIMAADASGSFTVQAVTVDGSSTPSYSVSAVASYTYTIAAVSAPTAIPTTSADSITTVDVGDSIVLISADASTRIFYTTDGTVPVVQQGVLGWESANDSTSYYNGAITVPSTDYGNLAATSTTLTINAIAVSTSDSVQQSAMVSYTYIVNPLPAADAPTASPAIGTDGTTALANGAEIYLSATTSGGQIYYTTNGAYPDVSAWYDAYFEAYLTNGFDGDLAEESAYQATGVQIFDINSPIIMQANSGGTFTVKAVTVDESTTPSYSISSLATFTYTLAAAASPTTSIATSADSVTIVSPGTQIQLMVTTANTTIYFTTDNSIPIASEDAPAYDPDVTQTGTVKYNSSTGITMPSDVSSLFTIRAIAHADVTDDAGNLQYADSAEAVFYYQLPAAVSLATASPIGATTTSQTPVSVVQGSTVSLASVSEDAVIYYEVFTSVSALESAMQSYTLTAANSQLYSETNQITIKEDCWIRAVATKDGMYSSETIFGYCIAETLDAPTASLASGAVVQKGSVIVLSASGDVVYTTDGSDPSAADSTATYGNSIVLNADEGTSMVIRAYSTADGYTPSAVVSFTYTICAADDYLQASPVSGSTVQSGSSIMLVTSLTGADIYYTTDGSTPTVTNSLDLYEAGDGSYTSYEWSAATGTAKGNSLTVTGSPGEVIIVKAIAVANGSTGTTTSVFTYTFAEQTPAPTASIPSGAITLLGASVTLTASEGNIYYTTDGTDPTSSSALYTGPIEITDSVVLKIRAYSDGKEPSEIVTYVYTRAGQVAAPTTDVPSGSIELGTTVSLSTTTENAIIYYSTDGTEPTVDNMESLMFYDQPFVVSRSVTIKMIAAATGMDPSVVNTVTYTVVDPVVEPEEEVVETPNITNTDQLVSRRDYSTQEDGPSYDGIVLQDSATQLIVSAEESTLASDTQLIVTQGYASDEETAIAEALGYEIVTLYEVALVSNGVSVVPAGTIEVGVPIADSAYNASISVAAFNGTSSTSMQTLETRRSGGYGYVMTDTTARYAVVVPLVSETFGAGISAADVVNNLPLIAFVGAVLLVGGFGTGTLLKRRARRVPPAQELPTPQEEYPTLDSFFQP